MTTKQEKAERELFEAWWKDNGNEDHRGWCDAQDAWMERAEIAHKEAVALRQRVKDQLQAQITDLCEACNEKQQIIDTDKQVMADLYVYKEEYDAAKAEIAQIKDENETLKMGMEANAEGVRVLNCVKEALHKELEQLQEDLKSKFGEHVERWAKQERQLKKEITQLQAEIAQKDAALKAVAGFTINSTFDAKGHYTAGKSREWNTLRNIVEQALAATQPDPFDQHITYEGRVFSRKANCWIKVFPQEDKQPNSILDWFTTKNPLLGNVSPYLMIKTGRGEKLLKFIETQLDENFPDHNVDGNKTIPQEPEKGNGDG